MGTSYTCRKLEEAGACPFLGEFFLDGMNTSGLIFSLVVSLKFRVISLLLGIIVQIKPLHPVQIIATSCVQSTGKKPTLWMKSVPGSWCSSSFACGSGELHHARVVQLQGCTSSRAVTLFQLLECVCVNSLGEGLMGFDPQRKEGGEKCYWNDEGATLLSPLIL